MAAASGKVTSKKRATAKKVGTRKKSTQAATQAKTAKTAVAKKTTVKKTETKRSRTTKPKAATAKTKTTKASELEVMQLKGQDGEAKATGRKVRQRPSKREAAEAAVEAQAVATEPGVKQTTKPVGLSSKTMGRQARAASRSQGDEAAKEPSSVKAKAGKSEAKPRSKQALLRYGSALPKWPASTEMLSLRLTLRPLEDADIYPQYNVGLHAWFLKQVQQSDADLSRRLHDNPDEKAFTLSSLDGPVVNMGDKIRLAAAQTYELTLTVFSKPVVKWLAQWLKQMPGVLELKFAPMRIEAVALGLPAMSYAGMVKVKAPAHPKLALSFLSPTSFRRKGNHLPLPMPTNLFGIGSGDGITLPRSSWRMSRAFWIGWMKMC